MYFGQETNTLGRLDFWRCQWNVNCACLAPSLFSLLNGKFLGKFGQPSARSLWASILVGEPMNIFISCSF